ncbi:MAG: hypothetical protein M0Q90_09015 [Bacteroidales bacterium]|nr:hypothetical protein [Bacteroidales bacterium]
MKNSVFSTLAFALIVAMIISSCTKQIEDPVSKNYSEEQAIEVNSPENQEMLNKIVSFKETLDQIKAGQLLKSDVVLSMSDAKWLIESEINVFHGFPNKEVDYFYLEEGVIPLPKDDLEDLMNAEEVVAFDESVKNIIIQQLSTYVEEGKHLVQTTLMISPATDSLYIKTLIGIESDGRLPYKDYYYGDNLGACDGSFVFETDAAKRLESMVHYHFITNRPEPPTNCRYVYVNPVSKPINRPWLEEYQLDNTPDNYLDFKIFFASDYYNNPPQGDLHDTIKCMDYSDEIQFYRQQYIDLIEDFQNETNKYYSGCSFDGSVFWFAINDFEYYSIKHDLLFTASTRLLVCSILPTEL